MHQNERFLPVFAPKMSLFLMNSAPFLSFGVLVVTIKTFSILLFYSLLGE